MVKAKVMDIAKSIHIGAVKHSPELLTGIGIAGMFATCGLAVKATPKALTLIEAKKKAEGVDELTPVETVQATWKCYIPAMAVGAASTACLIGASRVSVKRNAALAAAYEISKNAFAEYRDKVVETIGEETEHHIREKVDKAKIDKNPVSKNEVIITGGGDVLCYDAISGRYFKSELERIKRAENVLNKRMMDDMYISLNEFYDELDLDHTAIGDELGWNIDDGLIDLYFTSHITEDGRPCIVVNYNVAPKYGYSRLG